MTEYGIRIKDSYGKTILEPANKLVAVRYTRDLAAYETGNVTLSDLSGRSFVAFAVPVYDAAWGHIHKITVSGTTISWSSGGPSASLFGPSRLFVLLYG